MSERHLPKPAASVSIGVMLWRRMPKTPFAAFPRRWIRKVSVRPADGSATGLAQGASQAEHHLIGTTSKVSLHSNE